MKEQHDKNVAAKRGLNVIMGRLRESMPHLATLLPVRKRLQVVHPNRFFFFFFLKQKKAFVDDPKHPVSTEVVLNYLDELFSRENYLDIVDESNVQGRLVPIFLELARYHNHKLTFMGKLFFATSGITNGTPFTVSHEYCESSFHRSLGSL